MSKKTNRRTMKPVIFFGILSVFLFCKPSFAVSEKDVLFHASFNGKMEPEIARGNPSAKPFGKPAFAPGKDGKQALVIENRKSGVIYELSGNLNPGQGAISFWLSTVDWNGDDGNILQNYFTTSGPDMYLKIQHLWPFRSIAMMLCKGSGGTTDGFDQRLVGGFPSGREVFAPVWSKPMQEALSFLQPGVWLFLTFTWREGTICAYLNGESQGRLADVGIHLDPHGIGQYFAIGENDFNYPIFIDPGCNERALPYLAKSRKTLIQDFTICSQCLQPAQVKKMFEKGVVEYARLAEANPLEMFVDSYPSRNLLVCKMFGEGEGTAEARIYPLKSQKAICTVRLEKGGQGFSGNFDVVKLAVGVYEVKGYLLDRNNKVISESNICEYEKENPNWLNNHIGEEDKVLPPWTPMQVESRQIKSEGKNVENSVVQCWGRKYEFCDTLLPTQIVSQGEALLARPIGLKLMEKGAESKLKVTESQTVSSSATRVIRQESGRLGKFRVTSKTTMEYDGLIYMEIKFDPDGEAEVESISWEMALKPEYAALFHSPNRKGGILPDKIWQNKFDFCSYILWLGNDKVGIQWFSESDEGWITTPMDGKNYEQIQIVTGKEETVLRVNVVNTPAKVTKPLTIRFGLMPTPVKPLPGNWRKQMRMWSSRYWWPPHALYRCEYNDIQADADISFGWPCTSFGSAPKPDYMNDKEWGDYKFKQREINHNCHKQGLKIIPYSVIYWCGVHYTGKKDMPTCEFRIYGKEWGNKPGIIDSHYDYFPVCPASPGFCDWWVDNIVNVMVDKNGLDFDGIYYDGGHAIPSANLEYGCGYKAEDGVHPTWTVMANRKLMRRIYAGIKAKKPDALIISHSSCEIQMPQMAYVDAIYQGEDFGQPMFGLFDADAGGHYSKAMPLDYARAVASTSKMGIIPWYMHRLYGLGEPWKKNPDLRRELTREFMAMLYLHDVHAISCDMQVAGGRDILKVFDYDFGIGDERTQFQGYWNNSQYLSWEGKKSYVSLWNKPEGLALFIVANFADDNDTVKMIIQPKKLNLSEHYIVKDGQTGEILSTSKPDFVVPVKKYDFRLLVAEQTLPPDVPYRW